MNIKEEFEQCNCENKTICTYKRKDGTFRQQIETCGDIYNCCNCGGENCGCGGCAYCNACGYCKEELS